MYDLSDVRFQVSRNRQINSCTNNSSKVHISFNLRDSITTIKVITMVIIDSRCTVDTSVNLLLVRYFPSG